MEQLKRDKMPARDRLEAPVEGRRINSDLVKGLEGSQKAEIEDLPQTRLMETCRALGLDDSGRKKTAIVSRIAGEASMAPRQSEAPLPRGE